MDKNSFFNYYILSKTFKHLQLCLYSILISMTIAIPLGAYLAKSRFKRLTNVIFKITSIIQTIPALALIALLISFLAILRKFIFLPATGFFPSLIFLSLYAILPILTNTYHGIKDVNPTTVDVAKGLGMTSWQILFLVQFPLALKLIIGGIKIALIWTIGLTTLTSLIGSGGLGDLIMQGLRSMQIEMILSGTIPAAILAIFFDWLLSFIERFLEFSPKGKK